MDSIYLKRYQAVRLLGEGPSGRAYLARQIDLARPVVVKVIHETLAADPNFRERFARETAPMARFQHPFAVSLYDASLEDPLGPCLVMEYVRGLTLDQLVKENKGRLGVGRVHRLLGQLCDVLQAAHDQGLAHGNLKPSNVIVVEPDSPYEKIKVAEFGMARLIKASDELTVMSDESSASQVASAPGVKISDEFKVTSEESSVTSEEEQGRELHSPLITHHSSLITSYMSPEQIRGESPDFASDMFSLGVILFELLTGTLPTRSSETADQTPGSGILRGSPTALPRSLEAVLFGCLERDPNQRIGSPRELAELFGAALAQLQRQQAKGNAKAAMKKAAASPPLGDASMRRLDPDQLVIDSQAVVYHLQAYMPHSIAEHKLRGFVQDAGGELLESIPGLIRVRLGDEETKYELKKGFFSWFDRRTGLIEMYLRIRPADQDRLNMVSLTVLMRSMDGNPPDDPDWRARCGDIAQDLRGYLMAQDVQPPKQKAGDLYEGGRTRHL
jgi:serine/threonine-protein kinase